MRFLDNVVLVTGAAQGIGECAARSFAKEGAIVVLIDSKAALVKQVSESINAAKGRSIFFGIDVTKLEEVNMVVTECIKKFDRIDVLVHSAGIYKAAPFLSMTEQEWDQTLDVNLKGTFLCCQSVAREMVKKKSGKIVLLASVDGQKGGTIEHTHYGASKGGVLAFCKTLALELIPYGIYVNCVAPGAIDTEMKKDSIERKGRDWVKSRPIPRYGTVQEVADAILFLSSNESSYITGFTIDVNGGSYLR
jgi:NAD(P)-dependent dehydrogenase (short-subunit alcohol dehydrogenase family)